MTSLGPVGRDPDELVTVGNFLDPIAAELARSRLEADGLVVYVQGSGFGSLLPTATLYPIRLQVSSADAGRAAEILAEVPAPGLLPADGEGDDGERNGSGTGS